MIHNTTTTNTIYFAAKNAKRFPVLADAFAAAYEAGVHTPEEMAAIANAHLDTLEGKVLRQTIRALRSAGFHFWAAPYPEKFFAPLHPETFKAGRVAAYGYDPLDSYTVCMKCEAKNSFVKGQDSLFVCSSCGTEGHEADLFDVAVTITYEQALHQKAVVS